MINKRFDELKHSGSLPSPSGVGMQILQLTQGEDFSTDDVGQIIQSDPALTGKILKIANSAQKASVEPATTVAEATMRCGVSVVRNVALGFSLVSANRSGGCVGFDYDVFWSRSLARGLAAQALADLLGNAVPAEAFICGLLSDVGSLALANVHPDRYSQILSQTRGGTQDQLLRLEAESFDIHHAEVTAAMLDEWGLPESFGEAIMGVVEQEAGRSQRGSESDRLSLVLRVAERICQVCVCDPETEHKVWSSHYEALEAVREELHVDPVEFQEFCEGILDVWKEWGAALGVPTNNSASFTSIGIVPRDDDEEESAIPEEPTARPAVADGAACSQDRLKILAVDGDPAVRDLLLESLRQAGHEAQSAASGKEGLRVALKFGPDIVLASADAPELPGLDLCKTLRRFDAGQKVFFIIMTEDGNEDRIVEAAEAGVDDYFIKPVNSRLLMARIKSAHRVIQLQLNLEAEKDTVRKQLAELGVLTRRLRAASLTDPLTELPNRRYLMKRLEQDWASAERSGSDLSVIMLDIDKFKLVNDNYGHDAGDDVLREVSGILRQTTRRGEEPARLGGEEFLIILRECNQKNAVEVAERVREACEQHVISAGGLDRAVTLSLGVATRTPGMENIDQLIKAADEAVYRAKESGRNRVCEMENPGPSAQRAAG